MRKTVFRHAQGIMILIVAVLSCVAGTGGNGAPKEGNTPFLRTSLSGNTPLTGEEVLLTYTLYFTGDAPQVSDVSGPAMGGLWHEEIDPGRYVQSRPVTIDGIVYRSAVIRQFRLAALQSGRIVIEGYRLQCIVPGPSSASAGRTILLEAPSVIMQARPLPAPVPEGFSGAIGTFSLNVTADRTTARAGEPVTVTSTINGRGNLSTLEMPELAVPPAMHRRPAVISARIGSGKTVSSGSIVSEVILYPQIAGKTTIPPVRFTFFDPEHARYLTISSQPVTITVPGTENAGTAVAPSAETGEPSAENRNIPVSLPMAGTAVAVVLALIALFMLGRKRTGKLPKRRGENSPIPAANSSETPETARAALYAVIKQKGVMKPESLTREQLRREMFRNNIPETTCEEIEKLFESIDRLLYSPSGASEKEIDRVRTETGTLIGKLLQPQGISRKPFTRRQASAREKGSR
ncbi:MAG: protein BatD [Chlorobi bacterium]|nr:protein BatD [Chlorobiota bacterium]